MTNPHNKPDTGLRPLFWAMYLARRASLSQQLSQAQFSYRTYLGAGGRMRYARVVR